MVTVPAGQSGIAGVFKQKFQRWRFDAAVAKDDVVVANFKTAHLHPVASGLSSEINLLHFHRQDLSHLSGRGYLSFLDALLNDKVDNKEPDFRNHDLLQKIYAWHDEHLHHKEDVR